MNEMHPHTSPRWGSTAKLIFGLTFVAVLVGLVYNFRIYLGPLILALVLSYLLAPLSRRIQNWTKIPWRLSVSMIYLLFVIIILGLVTWGGLTLITQVQSLIQLLQNALVTVPAFLADLPHKVFTVGPFVLDFSKLDLSSFTSQILGSVQPLLSQVGSLVGVLATQAASLFGWGAFVMLISYFILTESGGIPARIFGLNIPGYTEDLHRLGVELGKIWNAFLRGQLIVTGISMLIYSLILTVLGVRYAIGLAILAGFAKFIPYAGPAIAWTTYGLVAYFQGYTRFGLPPTFYALLVVGVALVEDNLFDSLVTPRLMAQALKVHPAGVLLAALIGANLIGLVGVILAAPVLATVKLFVDYGFNKMLDRDPWAHLVTHPTTPLPPRWATKLAAIWQKLRKRNVEQA